MFQFYNPVNGMIETHQILDKYEGTDCQELEKLFK
jgi:hypothetical protein